jgi:AraC-like DNA-binding protein
MKKHYTAEFQIVAGQALANTAKSPDSLLTIFPSNPQLSQVFQFIEANYNQPISLSDVAIAVGYCATYLTDLVRRTTGHTVNDWIAKRRMVAARALLLETDQCVSQVAQAVGYQHEGYFFRQFRRHHGSTPQAWRKTQRS